MTRSSLKDLVYQVNGAAIEVHKQLGPGLLENVYHQCLKKELELKKINFSSEFQIPLKYKGYELESKLRCDLLIENSLVVELKSVVEINPIFEAQLLTYMNLLKVPMGLLINFNVKNIFLKVKKQWLTNFIEC